VKGTEDWLKYLMHKIIFNFPSKLNYILDLTVRFDTASNLIAHAMQGVRVLFAPFVFAVSTAVKYGVVSENMVTNALMVRSLFWLQYIFGTWVAEVDIRPPHTQH
jgi:hypothetical protein